MGHPVFSTTMASCHFPEELSDFGTPGGLKLGDLDLCLSSLPVGLDFLSETGGCELLGTLVFELEEDVCEIFDLSFTNSCSSFFFTFNSLRLKRPFCH